MMKITKTETAKKLLLEKSCINCFKRFECELSSNNTCPDWERQISYTAKARKLDTEWTMKRILNLK